ncbi:MAG: acetolactate synthase-1/2/3 large subunit [Gammaproteobacteria bacterium]|jgi:acetolactate synthase-1/2/3 large subunit
MTTGRPGSAHLGLPFDTQKGLVDIDEVWADPQFGQYPACRRSANEQEAEKLLNLLIDAEQPIIICGGGVVLSGAEAELKVLAHNLDIPVATTVSGQGSLAETDSLCVGVVGSNGGVVQTRKLVEEADLVFFIGCRAGSVTTERWRVPSTSKRIVHLDNDEKVLNAIYKTEVALYCDALLGLQTINALWGDRQSLIRNSADKVSAVVAEKFAIFNQIANQDSRPVRPERVVSELQSILPDDVIICVDPGTPCPYFSAYYQWQRPGRHFIANRAHGALGFALAAAMGAHVAAPEKTVIAAMGDGSFGFCCGEFETLLRYNIPITIIVFSNSGYGWIKAGQKTSFESRFHNVDFSCTDHAAVARAFGMQAWTVDDPTQLRSSLEAAIACEGPTLVDVISQPLQEANAPVSEWIS